MWSLSCIKHTTTFWFHSWRKKCKYSRISSILIKHFQNSTELSRKRSLCLFHKSRRFETVLLLFISSHRSRPRSTVNRRDKKLRKYAIESWKHRPSVRDHNLFTLYSVNDQVITRKIRWTRIYFQETTEGI